MLLERDPPIKWQAILLDFRRWGWTMSELERVTAIPRTTLLGWLNDGKDPMKFEDGRALVKLHAEESKRRERDTSKA